METFTVYGGCISRDIFNFLDNSIYKPILTIGQNPISTMFETPVKIDIDDFHYGTNFEKRMLYYDANKIALDKILDSNSEWFIFDVICERITAMEFEFNGQKGVVEKSWPFVDNFLSMVKTEKYMGMKKIRDIDIAKLGDEYELKIDKFCSYIANKYSANHIIFCELNLVNNYLTKDNKIKTFNTEGGYSLVSNYNDPMYANNILMRVTNRIKRQLPDVHYIPMPDYILADERHHFGLHPLHYSDDYYNYASSAVELIVKLKKPEMTKIPLLKLCELQSKENLLLRNKYLNNK